MVSGRREFRDRAGAFGGLFRGSIGIVLPEAPGPFVRFQTFAPQSCGKPTIALDP